MSVEKLWLCLPAVTTLPIPPKCTVRVEIGTGSAFDRDSGPRDLEQGSIPLFITPCSFSFEYNLSVTSQLVSLGTMQLIVARMCLLLLCRLADR